MLLWRARIFLLLFIFPDRFCVHRFILIGRSSAGATVMMFGRGGERNIIIGANVQMLCTYGSVIMLRRMQHCTVHSVNIFHAITFFHSDDDRIEYIFKYNVRRMMHCCRPEYTRINTEFSPPTQMMLYVFCFGSIKNVWQRPPLCTHTTSILWSLSRSTATDDGGDVGDVGDDCTKMPCKIPHSTRFYIFPFQLIIVYGIHQK